MHQPAVSPYKILAIEFATLVKGLNELLRFVLELGMLAAFAYWGAHVGSSRLAHVMTAIATPVVAALAWGMVLSPRAPAKLPSILRLVLSLPVFLVAALATYASGMPRAAIAFVVVATINTVILIALDDIVGQLQRATQTGNDERSPRRPIE
jgi:uncharacterized protein DUF2568